MSQCQTFIFSFNRKTQAWAKFRMSNQPNDKTNLSNLRKLVIFMLSVSIIVSAMPGRSTGLCAFIEPILKTSCLSRDSLSIIFMFTTMIGGFSMLFIGKKIDQIGTRKILFISLTLWILTMSLLGCYETIAKYFTKNTSRTLFNIIFFSPILSLTRLLGQNILTTVGHVQILQIFRKKTGLALSICNVIIAIAFGCSPKLINKLIETITWQHSYKAFAIISSVLLIISFFVLPKNDSKVEDKTNDTESTIVQQNFSKKEIFINKSFWCVILTLCVNSFIGSGIVIHAIDIFREIGETAASTMNSLLYIGLASMLSGILFGRLIDANRCKLALLLVLASQLVGMINLEFINNIFAFYIYVIAIGCSWGGYGLFFSAIWPKIFPIKNIGEVSGTVCCFTIFTGASSIPLMSLSKTLTGSYFTFIHMIEIFTVCIIIFVAKNFKTNT